MNPAKQTALVTGASSGIGREFSRLLAGAGHDLALTARRGGELETLAGELRAKGARVAILPCDLSLPGAAAQLAQRLAEQKITVDLLVNNAGLGDVGAFAKSDPAKTNAQMMVNMVALTELTAALLPGMIARRRGRIVNIASTASFLPGPFMAVYCATKAYVLSLSEALGEELRGSGVAVTAICPGPTHSEFAAVSGSTKRFDSAGNRVASAKAVAEQAWQAVLRGDKVAVLGRANRLNAWMGRHLPHSLLVPMARKALEPR